ncbi:unnamed protein product [Rotaria magnacalcarata]
MLEQKFSAPTYLALVMLNSIIGFLACYSMGMSERANTKLDKLVLNMNMLNFNETKIYFYVQMNCSKLLELYPEFHDFYNLKICQSQEYVMTLGKFSILLSTLYNTYLSYALYGPPAFPVILMILTSLVLSYTSLIKDEWTIKLFELASIMAGFMMIIGQCMLAYFGDWFKYQYSLAKNNLFNNRRRTDRVYDNLLPIGHQRND